MTSYDSSNFKPLVVIHFSPETPDETKNWLIKRLTAKQDGDNGADLLVRYDPDNVNIYHFTMFNNFFSLLLLLE